MFPKFIHLQSHFIHLYFLTEFEIIFYIFYVMPYEKSVFKKIIRDMIDDLENLVDDKYIYRNITESPSNNCDVYQTELDNANSKLWNYCVLYLGIINLLLLTVFIYDVLKNYRNYTPVIVETKKHNSKSNLVAFGSNQNFSEGHIFPSLNNSIELSKTKNDDHCVNRRNLGSPKTPPPPQMWGYKGVEHSSVETQICNDQIEIHQKEDFPISFCLYYWRNSGFVSEFIKTAEFIVLVGIFEYFFFISIVDKFKIANSQTLLCDGLKYG